jgi:hypothetical protein
MSLQLPESQTFRQFGSHENAWADHYGALHVAHAHAGLPLPLHYTLSGAWQHGSFGPWHHYSPHVLVYNAPGATSRPAFVARQDEADFMRAHGYHAAQAIGLPFVYVPEPQVPRMPRSLLVVPTHTLTGDSYVDRTPFETYARSVKELAPHFDRITVCIHPNCRRNGLWVPEFTAPGIEIVYGAETSDAQALLRMRMLFAQFESVTTNDWGSHVVYALASGCKVSIAGQPIAGNPAVQARDQMWANEPAMMITAYSPEVVAARRECLRKYHVSPREAVADPEFGRWFIGWDRRLTPAAMQEVLARLVVPRPETVQELAERRREQRRAVRGAAAQQVAAGGKAEAARLLLQFVQQVAATKDPLFIAETLWEIAAAMHALDPVRAAQLQEQAQILTGRIHAARKSAA